MNEEMVQEIIRRLRGRQGMNARTAAAMTDPNEERVCRRVATAYENAIADVMSVAAQHGVKA